MSCLYPQKSDKQIYLSVSPLKSFSTGDFEDIWNADIGIAGEFRFDHPIGQLGAGLSLMKFNSKNYLTPGFFGLDYYFLYRNQFELFSGLSLITGFDFGIYEFRFEDGDFYESHAEQIENSSRSCGIFRIDCRIWYLQLFEPTAASSGIVSHGDSGCCCGRAGPGAGYYN